MYKKILVPIDGSDIAECSLSHVKAIGTGCNVPEIVLLQVLKPLTDKYVPALTSLDAMANAAGEQNADAEIYLKKVANKMKAEGLNAQTLIIPSEDSAGAILDYARDNGVDLIVISTHGRSGPSRWVMGSVAERVMRHSSVPVLMVSPAGCRISDSPAGKSR
ncbi:MAG: universal stress protein [Dehalococcoidia bacterium]|nr:universal stress protein [Dehalococcoidia bacterium]